MHSNPFTDDELNRRLAATQEEMATRSLDLILLSAPEHVFYLTGLEHWGYFAPHVLIVPAAGDLVLVTRAMEHVVIRNQVRNAIEMCRLFSVCPGSSCIAASLRISSNSVSHGKLCLFAAFNRRWP